MKVLLWLILFVLFLSACSDSGTDSEESKSGIISFISPAGPQSSLPHLTVGGDNKLYLSWIDKSDTTQTTLKYAAFDSEKWTTEEKIASGTNWFVNWADYPMISVDNEGNKIAHYLAKSDSGTYSYDINVVTKPSGKIWGDPIVIHDDGTSTEHGFVTMMPTNDGSFLMAWLDGRNTGGGHGSDGAMTVRSAVINTEGELSEEAELDAKVCDCCQTGGVMTSTGPVIVYRDRSDEEIRDMYFVRKVDNEWSTPSNIFNDGWNITGCPVNGPAIASLGNTLAVAWFTAATNPEVKVSFSKDGGEKFSDPIIIDDSAPIGRVDVAMINEETAIVSWLDTSDDKPAIKYQRVTASGESGKPSVVAITSSSRSSGFPQMEILEGNIYFSWTSVNEDGTSTIEMAMAK